MIFIVNKLNLNILSTNRGICFQVIPEVDCGSGFKGFFGFRTLFDWRVEQYLNSVYAHCEEKQKWDQKYRSNIAIPYLKQIYYQFGVTDTLVPFDLDTNGLGF